MPENGHFRFPSSLLWFTQSLLPSYRFPSSPPATRHPGRSVLAPRWRLAFPENPLANQKGQVQIGARQPTDSGKEPKVKRNVDVKTLRRYPGRWRNGANESRWCPGEFTSLDDRQMCGASRRAVMMCFTGETNASKRFATLPRRASKCHRYEQDQSAIRSGF